MSKEKAEQEYHNYKEALKRKHEKYLEEMCNCFLQLKRGRKLIDIFEVMLRIGVNDTEEPRLAISNCNWKTVEFRKLMNGAGVFKEFIDNWKDSWKNTIDFPEKTFKVWSPNESSGSVRFESNIKNQRLKTKVPVIPAQFLPKGKLENYYVLWEVDKWEEIPKRKDPILLKRINKNLFAVLAVWKLSKLEQSIIRGR